MLSASVFNPTTPALCKIATATRILDDGAGGTGPKWKYTLKFVGLQYDGSTYATGDVTAYSPNPLSPNTLTAYNVNELANTLTTWFGLASTDYKGLEFNECPVGQVVLANMVPFEMLDSAGAFATGQPGNVALFNWPNQLSGTCT